MGRLPLLRLSSAPGLPAADASSALIGELCDAVEGRGYDSARPPSSLPLQALTLEELRLMGRSAPSVRASPEWQMACVMKLYGPELGMAAWSEQAALAPLKSRAAFYDAVGSLVEERAQEVRRGSSQGGVSVSVWVLGSVA